MLDICSMFCVLLNVFISLFTVFKTDGYHLHKLGVEQAVKYYRATVSANKDHNIMKQDADALGWSALSHILGYQTFHKLSQSSTPLVWVSPE